MKNSLFDLLHEADLTYFKISYNWRTNEVVLRSAREWDDTIPWSDYNKTFYQPTELTTHGCSLDNTQTRKLLQEHALLDYLENISQLLRKGRHHFIECFYCRKQNIRFMNNVHSDVLALNNHSHAIRAGGIRRHELHEQEYDVIMDGLNLARGMSFKNFAAQIPHGGAKMTVMMDRIDLDNLDVIGFLSYAVDRSRIFTGPDMGFPTELADVMNAHFTTNITGGPNGPLGPTGKPTALGVYLAAREAVKFKFGLEDLCGRTIAVQGMGAVGYPLCEHYLQAGASLIIADLNEKACRDFKQKHASADIQIIEPQEILYVSADLFSPCAMGGIIGKEEISKLNFEIILGAANNQLRASSQEEEFELARLLHKKGILFQVAWWHNVGGVLCGYEEYCNHKKADMNSVLQRVEEICVNLTQENLNQAQTLNITPTENAYKRVEDVIYA